MKTKKVTIDVTLDDIKMGGCSKNTCPVARGLLRVVKQGSYVDVDYGHISVFHRDRIAEVAHIETPPMAKEFIASYDARHHVVPFSFDMDLPIESIA